MIDRTQKYPTERDAPALSVCPRNTNNTNFGWKKNITLEQIVSKEICKDATNTTEFYDCIELNTYSVEELIVDDETSEDLRSETNWVQEFGLFPVGRCYLQYLDASAIGYSGEKLSISLNPALAFYVILVDPRFYMMTQNPKTIPRIEKLALSSKAFH